MHIAHILDHDQRKESIEALEEVFYDIDASYVSNLCGKIDDKLLIQTGVHDRSWLLIQINGIIM